MAESKREEEPELNFLLGIHHHPRLLRALQPLHEDPCYFGYLPRKVANELVINEGDWILRYGSYKGKRFLMLTIRQEEAHSVRIEYKNEMFHLGLRKNSSARSLINSFIYDDVPISKTQKLRKGIERTSFFLSHQLLSLETLLGSGAFGEVWKGTLKTMDNAKVAVKRLKSEAKKNYEGDFLKEALDGGSLKGFMQTNENSIQQCLKIMNEVVNGMCYLSTKHVIHRDLAARNLLVDGKGQIKISDFGLAKIGRERFKIRNMKFPIRWLAPEVIQEKMFSQKSDCWAFAVTCWEIFTLCRSIPYPTLTNEQVKKTILNEYPAMQAPDGTPGIVTQIMSFCFRQDPEERPTFTAISKSLGFE